MKTCPKCQQTYPDEIESCSRDGSRLAAEVRDERECPHCAELILKKAHVCKHCGRDVEPVAGTGNTAPAPLPNLLELTKGERALLAAASGIAEHEAGEGMMGRPAAAADRPPVAERAPQFSLLSDGQHESALPRHGRQSMSYAEKNLIAGERVVYMTGYHWVVLFGPIVIGALLGLLGICFIALHFIEAEVSQVGTIFGSALLIFAAVSVIIGVISKKTTEMAVTNRRVLGKVGFLTRKSYEILLTKIESIGIEESVLGRILGYGGVVVRGIGGTPEVFKYIEDPFQFRRQVQDQVDTSHPNDA